MSKRHKGNASRLEQDLHDYDVEDALVEAIEHQIDSVINEMSDRIQFGLNMAKFFVLTHGEGTAQQAAEYAGRMANTDE